MAKIVIRKSKKPAEANSIDKKAFMKEYDKDKVKESEKGRNTYEDTMKGSDSKRKKLKIYKKK